MGVEFLGTIKDSQSFTFQIVDLNELLKTVVNDRPSIQGYGTSISFATWSDNKSAIIIRNCAGKVQTARAATNLVECCQDIWNYKTDYLMTKEPHAEPLEPICKDESLDEQVEHA